MHAAQAASSGLAARLEAAFAAEEKRKASESAGRPVTVAVMDDHDDFEFDEDAIEAEEDAFYKGPAGGVGVTRPASPARAGAGPSRDALDAEADEFF